MRGQNLMGIRFYTSEKGDANADAVRAQRYQATAG